MAQDKTMISESSIPTEPDSDQILKLPPISNKSIQSDIKALRKKSMLSERSNFLYLKKNVLENFPKKKFNACAPREFSKLVLNIDQVILNTDYSAKYYYPEEVLSTSQIYRIKHSDHGEFTRLKSTCYKAKISRLKTLLF